LTRARETKSKSVEEISIESGKVVVV